MAEEKETYEFENENDYEPDLVTVVDDDGNEHVFDILDRVETDDGQYIAVVPAGDELLDSDGELIFLQVLEEEDEFMLAPIEDDEVFDEIASIFVERLSDLYDIEPLEEDELLN